MTLALRNNLSDNNKDILKQSYKNLVFRSFVTLNPGIFISMNLIRLTCVGTSSMLRVGLSNKPRASSKREAPRSRR
jgi:hypothetical protein